MTSLADAVLPSVELACPSLAHHINEKCKCGPGTPRAILRPVSVSIRPPGCIRRLTRVAAAGHCGRALDRNMPRNGEISAHMAYQGEPGSQNPKLTWLAQLSIVVLEVLAIERDSCAAGVSAVLPVVPHGSADPCRVQHGQGVQLQGS